MMDLKSRVLELLENNKNKYISGSEMAGVLGVTRTSVWKAIEALRKEGYDITASTNRGYRIEKTGDMLSPQGILRYIKTEDVFLVETRNLVTSTNTVLRQEAALGAPEGLVLAAEAQTEGKGRYGRKWHSPVGNAAYFSVILRPEIRAEEATLVTAAAAVASALAIESIYDVQIGIKWVNDLFYNGKKIAGLLSEATLDMDSGMIDNVVLGIGINVTRPAEGYPEEISDIATAITDRTAGKDSERCRLIAAVLDNFWRFYKNLPRRDFLGEYRRRSILLGKDVIVITGSGEKIAEALAIDDDCGLVVRYEDGGTEVLRSGEVRVSLSPASLRGASHAVGDAPLRVP